ncbi:MAG: Plug domain-containing protein, partial [Calditrichia bacterium]
MLDGVSRTSISDAEGTFSIEVVNGKAYYIYGRKEGFYTSVAGPVKVENDSSFYLVLEMLPGDSARLLYFTVGGISVTAEQELLPGEAAARYQLSGGEIEHLQATNLGDALDMIPGVLRKNQPGLQQVMDIPLRETERSVVEFWDRANLFGTKVIVDDIPQINQANLNSGAGVGYGSYVQSTAYRGLDLRQIPADNIEEVEVIPGLPSVEYGDFSTGIIRVKTAGGKQPLRLKLKHNPDIREGNLGGGFQLGDAHTLNFNLNNAYSLRDLRIDGDEVNRLNLQAKFSHQFAGGRLALHEKIEYARFFEDFKSKDDPLATRSYNHDQKFSWGQQVKYSPAASTEFVIKGFFSFMKRASYLRQNQIIPATWLSGSV